MMSDPPIDPEVLAEVVFPPGYSPGFALDDIPARRASMAPGDLAGQISGRPISVEYRRARRSDGQGEVALLVLRPAAVGAEQEVQLNKRGPGIVYLHGGGLVSGTVDIVDDTIVDAVADHGAVVIAVDYRLAPEHRFPAAVEDCYTALCWLADNTDDLGVDPDHLLVAGVSAGGGLAAAVAVMARDRNGPALTHQILYCPMLDDRERFPSSTELDGQATWDRHANLTGWQAYLGSSAGGPDVSSYAAAGREERLAGLPPAFIDVGSVETFRDEVLDYAARLSHAGIPVELHLWPGGIHGFAKLAPGARISQRCVRARAEYLARALAGQCSGDDRRSRAVASES